MKKVNPVFGRNRKNIRICTTSQITGFLVTNNNMISVRLCTKSRGVDIIIVFITAVFRSMVRMKIFFLSVFFSFF